MKPTDAVPPLQGTRINNPWHLLQVNRCLSIKGAEDVLNKPHAFEITTVDSNYFFIADSDKVGQRLLPRLSLRYSDSAPQAPRLAAETLQPTGEGGLDQCSRPCHCAAFQEVCILPTAGLAGAAGASFRSPCTKAWPYCSMLDHDQGDYTTT